MKANKKSSMLGKRENLRDVKIRRIGWVEGYRAAMQDMLDKMEELAENNLDEVIE